MGADPRRPLICGVAQATWHEAAPDPIAMCAQVARAAAADSGAQDAVLEGIDAVGVVDIASRRWADPAALVADELGIEPKLTLRTELGGDGPVRLAAELGRRVQDGELECALLCGAEALATAARAMAAGEEPAGWPPLDEGASPDVVVGDARLPHTDAEFAANMIAPVVIYPLFEYGLWNEQGGTIEEHRGRLGRLWERFASVARANPLSWAPDAPGPEEIATPSPANRLVSLPYTKLLNSNITTDQAAALIICSQAFADRAGIATGRRVYPLAFGHATDHWFVTSRERIDRSAAAGIASRGTLEAAGTSIAEVEHLDIYSCFPSAVQMACHELGIDPWTDPRELTVTGGLTFFGGPGNNYVTHSLASMVERLRENPGQAGLCTAVGWYMTKHGAAVLSSGEPDGPLAFFDGAQEVSRLPEREMGVGREGPASLEAASIVYDRGGEPTVATVTVIFDDGARGVGKSTDPELMALLARQPATGTAVRLTADGLVEPA
ncbi:MAG: acetyl-CoA acetyltransferase [Solirubrobacterales bacterium]